MRLYAYVGGNPLYLIDPLGLAQVSYEEGVPDYLRRRLEKNLAALEMSLINNTSACGDTTNKYLELFFDWNIKVTNFESPADFAGDTDGRKNSTTLYQGMGSLGDLAHEFYHTTPENINRKTGRGAVHSPSAPSEHGPYGGYDFEGSVERNECLCKYDNGESLSPDPELEFYRNHDARPAWKRLFGIN